MTIDRAIEILDPEHRENYDGMDEVNEACRMGMEALERTRWIPCSERLPKVCKDTSYLSYIPSFGAVDIARRYCRLSPRRGRVDIHGDAHHRYPLDAAA